MVWKYSKSSPVIVNFVANGAVCVWVARIITLCLMEQQNIVNRYVPSHSCPMKMETTHVSETSTIFIHTPGNYPKKDNIRFSQHGESLKTRRLRQPATVLKGLYKRPDTLWQSAAYSHAIVPQHCTTFPHIWSHHIHTVSVSNFLSNILHSLVE
jgi:hypothetical protein